MLNICSRIGAGPNPECVGTEWNRPKVKGPEQSMQWVRDSGQRKGLKEGIRAKEGIRQRRVLEYPASEGIRAKREGTYRVHSLVLLNLVQYYSCTRNKSTTD